ncbi:MAG: caspase family protein [Planctomycetota bacterium]
MSSRRAVLIGIENYEPRTGFSPLPVVHADIAVMADALESSGYEVEEPLVGEVSRTNLLHRIRASLQDAVPEETLLIYFSGHGVYRDRDTFLVPSEAGIRNPENDEAHTAEELHDFLVATDKFKRAIETSQARNVIFVVDACRQGLNINVDESPPGSKGRVEVATLTPGELEQKAGKAVWFVYSCAPGATSHFGELAEHESISYFTFCVAAALRSETEPRDIASLESHVKEQLKELAGRGITEQEIRIEPTAPDDAEYREICKSSAATSEFNPWRNTVEESSLLARDEKDCLAGQFRDAVCAIVDVCWQQWCVARERFEQDPWLDEEFPIRVIRKLEILIEEYIDETSLQIPELALLLVAPFMREAAFASARLAILESDPTGYETGWLDAKQRCVEVIRNGSPRMLRKVERMREKGEWESLHATSGWILHQSVLRSAEVWQPGADEHLPQTVFQEILDAVPKEDPLIAKTFDRDSLIRLSRVIHANPDRLFRTDVVDSLDFHDQTLEESAGRRWHIRQQPLGGLLCFAGWLAIDVRTLDTVLVDHFGLSQELSLAPTSVIDCIRKTIELVIASQDGEYRMQGSISHAALDKALRNQADLIAETSQALVQGAWADDQMILDWRNMPSRIATHNLKPAIREESGQRVPAFSPDKHIEFQLADREIRDLLMGEKLYGDPTLAIRELYQNALDACRFREARLTYLDRKNGSNLAEQWDAKIQFDQGVDDQGNAYIRCRDTGIGMDRTTIENCFAKAGGRYAEATEFLEEQARWRSLEEPVEFHPNSQFGIGVFSYFMLADEILVRTRRLRSDGHIGNAMLEVRVSGSGSLFHIREVDGGLHELPEAGTEITLFLNKTEHEVDGKKHPISARTTLQRLLWIAEFPTSSEDDGGIEQWIPYELKLPNNLNEGSYRHETRKGANADFWWLSQKEGRLLCDGVATDTEYPFAVVNLRRKYRPEMTADRKSVRRHPRGHVTDLFEASIPDLLPLPTWLTMEWLWELSCWNDREAESLVMYLIGADVRVRIERAEQEAWVRLACVGCVVSDYGLLERNKKLPSFGWRREFRSDSSRFRPSRRVAVRAHALRSQLWFWGLGLAEAPDQGSRLRFLTCTESDSIVLSRDLDGKSPWLEGDVSGWHVLRASQKLDESVAATFARLQRWAGLLDLDLSQIDVERLSDLVPTREDFVALSRDLRGIGPWLEGRVSGWHVLLASQKLDESVAATFSRLQGWAGLLDLDLSQIDVERLSDLFSTQEDCVALSRNLRGNGAWLEGRVSGWHVLRASQKLDESVAATFARLQRWAGLLDLDLSQIDVERLSEFVPAQEDLVALSRALNGRGPWIDGECSVERTLAVIQTTGRSVARTCQRLVELSRFGVLSCARFDLESTEDLVLRDEDWVMLSKYLDGKRPFLGHVSAEHIGYAAMYQNRSEEEIRERLQDFACLGVTFDAEQVPDTVGDPGDGVN